MEVFIFCFFVFRRNGICGDASNTPPPNQPLWISEIIYKTTAQLLARVIEPHLNRLGRALQNLGDLPLGQLLVFGQEERLAQFLRQPGDGITHDNLPFGSFQMFSRICSFGRQPVFQAAVSELAFSFQ